eukprot:TRINITY_DN18494_c0_g1_i1.p1 TRINITY_DN18494_c0_g1~~TRINITY_DN18494_c0_g1_i1.p1  ORF type:complete len:268 (-),score=6.29 TRINITY_DN18494_c0_g1_i1:109-912(-)
MDSNWTTLLVCLGIFIFVIALICCCYCAKARDNKEELQAFLKHPTPSYQTTISPSPSSVISPFSGISSLSTTDINQQPLRDHVSIESQFCLEPLLSSVRLSPTGVTETILILRRENRETQIFNITNRSIYTISYSWPHLIKINFNNKPICMIESAGSRYNVFLKGGSRVASVMNYGFGDMELIVVDGRIRVSKSSGWLDSAQEYSITSGGTELAFTSHTRRSFTPREFTLRVNNSHPLMTRRDGTTHLGLLATLLILEVTTRTKYDY